MNPFLTCRIPALFSSLLMLGTLLYGADPTLSMQLSRNTISLDEGVQLTLQVVGGQRLSKAPSIPFPDGLVHEGTSQSIRHVQTGSRRSTVAQFIYNLRATRTGDFRIGPYTLGQQKLNALNLTVTPGAKILSESWASKTNLLAQETFDFHFTVSSPVPISNLEISSFERAGLDVTKLTEQPVPDDIIDGKKHYTVRFGAKASAQQPGTYEIRPTVLVSLRDHNANASRSVFGSRTASRKQRIVLTPIEVRIQRPPSEGQPADYSGAIGAFSLTIKASPINVQVGDPITLTIQLVGKGNMRAVLPPTLGESEDFQVYDAKLIEERLNTMGNGGYKTYEQVIVPRNSLVAEIPVLRFNFFDPTSMTYQETSQGPFPLTVTAGGTELNPMVGSVTPSDSSASDTTLLGTDLLYLKPAPKRSTPPPLGQKTFIVVCAAPLLAYGAASLLLFGLRSRKQNPARQRRAQAPRVLRTSLSRLANLEDNPAGFHDEIWNGLHVYFANRFGLEPGDVSPAALEALLGERIPEDVRRETRDWFSRVEQARFGVIQQDRTTKELTDDLIRFTKAWEAIR